MPYMETTTHHRRGEIVVEKRSLFRPRRGLAASDLLLDAMLSLTYGNCQGLVPRVPQAAGYSLTNLDTTVFPAVANAREPSTPYMIWSHCSCLKGRGHQLKRTKLGHDPHLSLLSPLNGRGQVGFCHLSVQYELLLMTRLGTRPSPR
jgi:hypothetical protein